MLQRLIKSGLVALIVKVSAAGLSLLMLVALAQGLDLEQFGRFGVGFSAATFGAVVGSMGMRNLVLRFASIYQSENDRLRLVGLFRTGYLTVLGGGLIVCVPTTIWVWVTDAAGSLELGLAASALLLSFSIAEFQSFALRAFGGMAMALAPRDILWRLLVTVGGLAAALSASLVIAAELVLWLCALSLFLIALVQMLVIGRGLLKGVLTEPARYEFAQWRKAAPGLWGSSVVQIAAPNLAVLVIGGALGPTEAGLVFAASRLALLLSIILLAANMAAGPMLSRSHAQNQPDALAAICQTVALGAGLAALAGWLVFLAAGAWLMGWFGEGYQAGYSLLLIIAAGQVVNAMAGPTSLLLDMTGREGVSLAAGAAATGIGLVVMIVSIPYWGALGAAAGLLISSLVSNITLVVVIRRLYRFDPSVLAAGKVLAHLRQKRAA